jgi:hypothetical protein
MTAEAAKDSKAEKAGKQDRQRSKNQPNKEERREDRKERAEDKAERAEDKAERREDRHERAEDLNKHREDRRERAEDRRDHQRDRVAELARYRSSSRETQRERMNVYYRDQYRQGRCPSGFYRSYNRCNSPAQSYGWRAGYRLPSTIVYYDLPGPLYSVIQPAPYGHRYIQVGGDILLIDLATLIVVDSFTLSYY